MALLFSLHLSHHVDGFGKPSVHARPAGIVGHYVDGVPYQPDRDAVRAALPHYWRKAFDRTNGTWWFNKHDATMPATLSFSDRRGRYLNTLYAIPYQFSAGA